MSNVECGLHSFCLIISLRRLQFATQHVEINFGSEASANAQIFTETREWRSFLRTNENARKFLSRLLVLTR